MPIQQISTFDDLLRAWGEAVREAEKRAVWRLLTRGGWLQACRNAVQRQDDLTLQTWLDTSNTIQQSIIEFNGEETARLARLYLQCGLAACGRRDLSLENAQSGFCKDLLLTLSDLPLRRQERDLSLTVLLVDTARNEGAVASLTLALIPNGAGALYPLPELTFLRDTTFQEAEVNACTTIKAMGLWPPTSDVRWSLQRRDSKPVANLSGPSLGAAFALGLSKLYGKP
jgi:hypothetical protein